MSSLEDKFMQKDIAYKAKICNKIENLILSRQITVDGETSSTLYMKATGNEIIIKDTPNGYELWLNTGDVTNKVLENITIQMICDKIYRDYM